MRNLLRGHLGGVTTPSAKHVNLALAAAAVVLWGLAGWTWWVLLPLLVAGVVARLLVWLFFEPWREWAGPAVLAAVIVFLMAGWGTIRSDLIAFGVVVLGIAWHLRTASPKWMRWVALVVGASMVVGGGLAEFVVWANSRAQQEAAEREERAFRVAEMRPQGGGEMIHALIRGIYENDPDGACWLFSDQGKQQFAAAYGVDDCAAAVDKLNGQITDRSAFGNATVPFSDMGHPDGRGVIEATGCGMYTSTGILEDGPPGGPTLGQLRLEHDPRFPQGGYLITGYSACDEPRPGETSTAPSTSALPQVLPSYPPGYAATLAQAAAERDGGVCVYFTDQGKQQFAAAYGVDDCVTAVSAIADQVTDPALYSDPQGAKAATDADDVTTVDACTLTWSRFGDKPSAAPPGPQLGRLVLAAGPGGKGYLVDGYERC